MAPRASGLLGQAVSDYALEHGLEALIRRGDMTEVRELLGMVPRAGECC